MVSVLFSTLPIPAVFQVSAKALVGVFLSVCLRLSNSATSDGTERPDVVMNLKPFLRLVGRQHIASSLMQDWGIGAHCPAVSLSPLNSIGELSLEAGQLKDLAFVPRCKQLRRL